MAVQIEGSVDGYSGFDGGQNEGAIPSLIGSNQTARNLNTTLRNRSISPRPALVDFDLEFLSDALRVSTPLVGSITHEQNFFLGRRQHTGKFQTSQGEYLIHIINGVIYAIDLTFLTIRVVKISGTQKILNYNLTRINGGQSKNEYVIYDWPNTPVVIKSDFTTYRATLGDGSNPGIPRSYIGAHVHERLHVGNAGIEFGSSDIRTDNPLITFKDSIVTPNNPNPAYPNQFFKLQYIDKLSPITAMGFLHQPDDKSALGFGPLMISTKEAIHLAAVNQPRANWGSTQAFVRVILYNYGITGPKAFCNVGKDVYYKSFDGHIYTLSKIVSDENSWGITHISQEIVQSLITRNKHLLRYSALAFFDNRIFVTLRPFIVEAMSLFAQPIEEYVSNGLGVLELNNVTGIGGNSGPVWAGEYTGNFTDMVEVNDRLIILGRENGRNTISQLNKHRFLDYRSGVVKKIRVRVYTREFDFKAAANDKIIRHVQPDVRNILGRFIMHVYYRLHERDDWKIFGSLYYKPEDPYRRSSVAKESISAPSGEELTCRNIQFRIDISGEDYELVRFTAFADLVTNFKHERILDQAFHQTEEFRVNEDMDV